MKAVIRDFIEGRGGDFEALALALHDWQVAHNPDYAAIAAGAHPHRWEEIPAVPVALFRDLPLCCFPPEQARVVFRTSGTTGGEGSRGVHRLLDTELYDLGARLHAESCLGPLPREGVGLVSFAPDASLGHMCRDFVPGLTTFFSADRGVDAAGFRAALAQARAPLFVPGTAFAFAAFLEADGPPCPLPPGSVVMVTGGFKGRATTVDADGLLAALAHTLPGGRLVAEYGMTELSSQLWAVPADGSYHPPPWMRVLAVDPWNGRPLPPGARGLLRFFDLANHQSVLGIETEDEGVVEIDGRVRLFGRLAGAEPRGCSLTVEEADRGLD